MDKTYRDEFYRLFVIDRLPGSVTPADAHLQIYDNYVSETRLRFRRTRVPGSRDWKYVLQQRIGGSGHFRVSEIVLDDAEYRALGAFEGNEIRKNRYFAELDDVAFEFDLFLGPLAGLITARTVFAAAGSRDDLEIPFAAIEVTDDPAFDGSNLYRSDFASIRSAVKADADAIHAHLTRIGEIAGENE